MTLKELLEKGSLELKINNINEPKIKARLLMQYILNKPREYLLVHDDEVIKKNDEEKYLANLKKIIKGIPLQHITHSQEFMKMNFYVDENVLIPRQDTECLVEETIKIAKKVNAKKFLDLCTGSGIIAVSIAKYIKDSNVTALDISANALEIAKLNSKKNGVEDRITFVKSNLFESLGKEKYDIIVSNPPYIKKDILKTLDKDVQNEPHIALDGGYDGLDFYRKIIGHAYEYLKYNGYLCLEIGYDQKEDIISLLEEDGKYTNITCIKDLYDNDRVIVAKLIG